jgi:hypothetical protein
VRFWNKVPVRGTEQHRGRSNEQDVRMRMRMRMNRVEHNGQKKQGTTRG